MTIAQLTKRVAELEAKVKLLQEQQKLRDAGTNPRWYTEEAGRFRNDPLFEVAVREGRKYRESIDLKNGHMKVKSKRKKRTATHAGS